MNFAGVLSKYFKCKINVSTFITFHTDNEQRQEAEITEDAVLSSPLVLKAFFTSQVV